MDPRRKKSDKIASCVLRLRDLRLQTFSRAAGPNVVSQVHRRRIARGRVLVWQQVQDLTNKFLKGMEKRHAKSSAI